MPGTNSPIYYKIYFLPLPVQIAATAIKQHANIVVEFLI
jgi:hypothetical protein